MKRLESIKVHTRRDISELEHIQAFFNDVVTTHGSARNLPSSCTSRLPPPMIKNILAPGVVDPHGTRQAWKLDINHCSSAQLQIMQGEGLDYQSFKLSVFSLES